jgi:hypothetical protein
MFNEAINASMKNQSNSKETKNKTTLKEAPPPHFMRPMQVSAREKGPQSQSQSQSNDDSSTSNIISGSCRAPLSPCGPDRPEQNVRAPQPQSALSIQTTVTGKGELLPEKKIKIKSIRDHPARVSATCLARLSEIVVPHAARSARRRHARRRIQTPTSPALRHCCHSLASLHRRITWLYSIASILWCRFAEVG